MRRSRARLWPLAVACVLVAVVASSAAGQAIGALRAGARPATQAPAPNDALTSRDVASALTRASKGRIAAQLAGSALAAGAAGFLAWQLLDDPEGSDRRVKGDAGYTPNANSAYAAASFIGSVAAAYLIGRGDGSRGSLGATALGAGLATIPLALGRHEPYLPIIGLVLGAPAQAIGATLGYQLTRRER